MKHLKKYHFNESYYDTDAEFKKLLKEVLYDTKFTLLDVEDSDVSIIRYSFKVILDRMENILGGYEWNPKMGDSSIDKYIESCLLSTRAIFDVRKWLYGDSDVKLILDVFMSLPAEKLGKNNNLISNTQTLQLVIDSINRLGYKYYLDFNSVSSSSDKKPLTIKIVIKKTK